MNIASFLISKVLNNVSIIVKLMEIKVPEL